jgi:hypothetical protein
LGLNAHAHVQLGPAACCNRDDWDRSCRWGMQKSRTSKLGVWQMICSTALKALYAFA